MDAEERSTEISMEELAALVDTAGADTVAMVLQTRQSPDPRSFLGAGKLQEIKEIVTNNECDLVVIDNELSPSQARAIEEELGVRVVDRSGLILDIFAQRARTKEGRLQVQLAQYEYLLPRLTGAAAGTLPPLVVAGDDFPTPDGTGLRDYVHVCDIARGHVAALEAMARREGGVLTCNLGAGRPISVLELIEAFENATGVSVPHEVGPRRAGDLAVCWADASRALAELDWKPIHTIEDACRDAWSWQSKNPRGYGE